MTSGGSRYRSGPAPDPNALRRDRSDDREWKTLPSEGRKGRAPAWPLDGRMRRGELALWRTLWTRPQAIEWEHNHLELEVASYVRAYLESVQPDASASLKGVVRRMQEDLGLSLAAMARHRWRIARDELGARRNEKQAEGQPRFATVTDVRTRLKAVDGG